MNTPMQRTSPLVVLAFEATGIAAGLIVQFARSASGRAPLAPPYSLPATMLVLGAVLVILAILLRRRVARPATGQVNPFHAVRVLAAARASQFVGALIGGFGLGLVLSLAGRPVPTGVGIWLPMVATLVAGLALLICGVIAEHLCRVPPQDHDDVRGAELGSDPADQPA